VSVPATQAAGERAQEAVVAGAGADTGAGADAGVGTGAGAGRLGRASLISGARAVWAKDVRAEWRSRYSMSSSIVFAAATLAVLSFAVGPQARRPELASALLWTVLLFSATASLSHGFAREVEGGTWDLLRQAAGPGEVLLGKWLAAATLLAAIEVVIVGLGALLIAPAVEAPWALVVMLAAGSLALAVALPLVAALIAQARRHGGLAAVLAFPLLVPGLFAAVSGTRRALEGGWPGGELRVLAAFTGALALAGWRLFEFIWDE
jgi:heme exporter protein B